MTDGTVSGFLCFLEIIKIIINKNPNNEKHTHKFKTSQLHLSTIVVITVALTTAVVVLLRVRVCVFECVQAQCDRKGVCVCVGAL